MRIVLCLGLVLCAALSACGGRECRDADGDGRGEGCARGPDCDDRDRALGEDCTAKEAACEADPFAAGCACLAGSRYDCYAGAAQTLGVSGCRAGRQTCAGGRWSACEGAIEPVHESCNGQDDDCDGIVDEGALSPCGGCNPQCTGGVWGPPTVPFEAEGELAVTELGELTLRQYALEALTIWVPNTGEGTLSKVDAARAVEVARYRVAGEPPERVAVDHNGDAWVLSPGFASDSYLTKVAADRPRCIDRNGDGLVTSSEPSDLLPLGDDECVILQIPVAAAGEVARTLAVDGSGAPDAELGGDVWIGLQNAEMMLELDGERGELLNTIPTPGFAPHAAVFDPWGTLWAIDRGGLLARIRPGAPPEYELIEAPLRCYEFESLASDARGVLTLTGFACEDVVVYDPRRDAWDEVQTPGVLDTRGVASIGDESWVVHTAGRVSRVQRAPLELLDTFELATNEADPFESIAAGADSLGKLWVVSSMGAPGGLGVLSRFDPSSLEVTAQVPLGLLPRAQGDITGDRRLAAFAHEGRASHVFEGCESMQTTEWKRLHLGFVAGEGAHVDVEARRAEARGALDAAAWRALGTLPEDTAPFALPLAAGGVVEVRLTLRVAGRLGAPRITRVGLEWSCPGPD